MSIEVIKAFRQKPIVIYPVYLDITGDYATAAALGQVLYWHEVMHGKFYKTDSNFEQELHLTPKQFRRVKTELKSLPFLKITVEQIPAKTFYDVDYEILTALIEATLNLDDTEKGQTVPVQKGETVPAQKGETVPAQKGETVPAQKGETITENTTELKTKIKNNNNATFEQSEILKNLSDKIPLLSLSFLNPEQTATAVNQLRQLSPEQQKLAIEIYENQASKGIASFDKSPIIYWQGLIRLGKTGKLQPINAAINQIAMQSPTKTIDDHKNALIIKIKEIISNPRNKEKMLKKFEISRAVLIDGMGHAFKDDLKLAGLFD
jgi:hypothetical protein